MRVSDYIASFLNKNGIDTVYMVSGGGMMFLSDGLACNENIKVVCNHHEQASAMAAVAHAKYKGLGCAYITTGCGGTNAMTGLLHAWQDSTACIFISGQGKRKDTIRNSGLPLRQLGTQEADIISLVEPITKYSVMINEPFEIRYHLEKALYYAKSGRPGPVWLDVPLDVQSAEVDVSELHAFICKVPEQSAISFSSIINALKKSLRPLIIAGQGVRLSGSLTGFYDFTHRYNIPIVCSRLGLDVMPSDDDLYIGRIGIKGTRAANFAVQNADMILVLGSRLSICSTGYEFENFAPNADIYVVDIDDIEHKKNTVKITELINCDLKEFFSIFPIIDYTTPIFWREKCLEWKNKYSAHNAETVDNSNGIDLYFFINTLSECIEEKDIIVTDAGSAVFVTPQGLMLTSAGQRYITSGGQAEMGFTLPGTIGAAFASGERVIGITGDGSFQMNIQELQTIVHHGLPIKLFIWNNQGYLSIRDTQNRYFNGRLIGTDPQSGVSFPDLYKIAGAYGIYYLKAACSDTLFENIQRVMRHDGPVICEVICNPNQKIMTITSRVLDDGTMVSAPLDDMYPFLSRKEYEENCIRD